MGCGASNNGITGVKLNNETALNSGLQQQQRQNIYQRLPSASLMSSDLKETNVLISCHTTQGHIAEQLQTSLRNLKFTCNILTDTTPQSIIARANLIRWCDMFIVIISRSYQRTSFCMETINYAKDVRKPTITILAEPNFEPYGGLGALSASAVKSMMLGNDGISENFTRQISSAVLEHKSTKKAKNVMDPAKIASNSDSVNIIHGENQSTVLICTVDEGLSVAQLIYNDFLEKKLDVAIEDLSKPNASCSVRRCTVLVPVLSPQFEQIPVCQVIFEEARRLHKPIVPVIAIKNWRSEGWLGLTIAGCIYFRIFDREDAYKPFYDSNRITDLRVEVQTACRPVLSQAEREKVEMNALKAKIEECKSKLQTWPPPRKSRTANPLADRQAVRVQLEEPSAKLRFIHIHHSITRMDMTPPEPLLDEYGLPKRRELDCMISYQWDDQHLVRKFYEDMRMREVRTWFDIWGSMQGNTNEAMATGVECAKVLLVFISKEYLDSVNCLLEFRYAVKRGKGFIIIRTQPNLQLDRWMKEAIEGFPQYDIFRYNDLENLINGVPTIDVIIQAVRTIAQAQPPDIVDDCSAELYELRSLLDDARDALSIQSGQTRYKTCTRCNQQFDEYTKGGCKIHRSYYVGGSIIEGRWVCCRQQAKSSPGCNPCDHTDTVRVFTRDPNYGTWTWIPS